MIALSVYFSIITQICLLLVQKNLRHFLNKSDAKPKQITTRSPAFSRALARRMVVSPVVCIESLSYFFSSAGSPTFSRALAGRMVVSPVVRNGS